MDIDSVSSQHSPSEIRSYLSEDEVAKINQWMTYGSAVTSVVAGDDSSCLVDALIFCFSHLISGLSNTVLRDKLIETKRLPSLVQGAGDSEIQKWRSAIRIGLDTGNWMQLVACPVLWEPRSDFRLLAKSKKIYAHQRFTKAYGKPYLGGAVTDFVKYVREIKTKSSYDGIPIYGKAFYVVQSSGTGKSRMLTEAGKQIFTLPICLRRREDPGFPLSDAGVFDFFNALPDDNDLSYTTHVAIACFLAAAHERMLCVLEKAYKERGLNGSELRSYWHNLMEPSGDWSFRNQFFAKVIERANELRITKHKSTRSPRRDDETEGEINIDLYAKEVYEKITKKATESLVKFLSAINGGDVCVTYFDEAHELGLRFWMLLRLLYYQNPSTKMVYVFMGTKSHISFHNPKPKPASSLRLRKEIACPLPPYVMFGFDQEMIANSGKELAVCMGELQTIEHLSKYGRPLWNAHLSDDKPDETVFLASLKLVGAGGFSTKNMHHVFAVLSQRLCLDPVLSGSEAMQLADRSVACHMRLITGFSANQGIFYTHSPSEPILVLGSASLMYEEKSHHWGPALSTLSQNLCSAGLVEKGVFGELAARTLLLIARDFASESENGRPNLLKPIPLMAFLDKLFGDHEWVSSNRASFEDAFGDSYVNFTHWIVSKDQMPETPDQQLLANLWARGAALQCCFIQESIRFLLPVYKGSVATESLFDPSCLSVVAGQVRFQVAGNKAEAAICPNGVPGDFHQPLPYLVLLLELGDESKYQGTSSRIKTTVSEPSNSKSFMKCAEEYINASIRSQEHQNQQHAKDEEDRRQKGDTKNRRQKKGTKNRRQKKDVKGDKLKQEVATARQAMDSYNRYSISVRGASSETYGILKTANIVKEFDTFLQVIAPSPQHLDLNVQYMRPLERLGHESGHTSWMLEYIVDEDSDGTAMVS